MANSSMDNSSPATSNAKSSAPTKTTAGLPEELQHLDLRNAPLAAVLGWLIPGAGHLYQRRYAKGALFMACILGIYLFGLVLGEGKVVHTGGTPSLVQGTLFGKLVQRWTFAPQACVGAPAIVAVYQHLRVERKMEPILWGWFAPPRSTRDLNSRGVTVDELAYWNEQLNQRYDIGVLFTMVAGLLNVLAIYDAFAGPVIAEEEDDEDAASPAAGKDKGEKS